ncbi:PIN domain-containing protein [Limnohabitans sp. Rim8]|uniref:PIN domain-containing protein n=1 Tax=Limnohabitans sp. Rim8 TaxID=1100718 RepID=UPI00262CD210|nr:PIN domain-containing protein [Limnohabitans sp. Rim8]
MKSFIDTNVLIYWVDDSARADVVEQLLSQQAVISVQVLNEFANVLRRKRAMALPDVEALCATLIDTCDVLDLSVRTHQTALTLMARYNLSVYDANIVAAAALSGCAVLYSEDMQDGLNLKLAGSASVSALVIRNPFKV